MTRTFLHSFEPATASPITGTTVDLEVSDIEDAGIREMLQTPGVAYGAWSILDALLAPTGAGTPFIFKEPLGQAREAKVALSGLFGRFVARAYLERYVNLSIFAHLGSRTINRDRRRLTRLSRSDRPDWITCAADLSSLTVAEAKGCHDRQGTRHHPARGAEPRLRAGPPRGDGARTISGVGRLVRAWDPCQLWIYDCPNTRGRRDAAETVRPRHEARRPGRSMDLPHADFTGEHNDWNRRRNRRLRVNLGQ